MVSNLRYIPEGERFDLLLQAGRDNAHCSQAVADILKAANAGRLLAFLDIDPHSAMRGCGCGRRCSRLGWKVEKKGGIT